MNDPKEDHSGSREVEEVGSWEELSRLVTVLDTCTEHLGGEDAVQSILGTPNFCVTIKTQHAHIVILLETLTPLC